MIGVYETVSFEIVNAMSNRERREGPLEIHYRLIGTELEESAVVFPRSRIDESLLREDLLRQEPNFREFPFLAIDEEARVITFLPGHWKIEQDLILPAGYLVLSFL